MRGSIKSTPMIAPQPWPDALLLRNALGSQPNAFEILHVTRLADAAPLLAERRFDAIVTDLSLPDAKGLEAVQLHRDVIDLVITDLIMPGSFTARDLAADLAAERPTLPVIFCSGYSNAYDDPTLALREGENFVSKPYSIDLLLGTVSAALGARSDSSKTAAVTALEA